MEDLPAKQLTDEQLSRLHRTIGSDAFFLIVMHHILTLKGMSAIRLGDFEPLFYSHLKVESGPIEPFGDLMNEGNYRYLGVHGIDKVELNRRIRECANADYLAFSVSGYVDRWFDPSPWFSHPRLIDSYFSNNWTGPMIRQLLARAGGVLMINRDESLGCQFKAKVPGSAWLPMNDWRDAEQVAEAASMLPHQLVLLSGGPGGKWIANGLARSGKVVLDVGQSAWCYVDK